MNLTQGGGGRVDTKSHNWIDEGSGNRICAEYLRVSEEDVHAVLSVLFVFAFRLEDELLEDIIVPGYNANERERGKQEKDDEIYR